MITLATKVYVAGRAREQAMDGLRSLIDNAVGDLDVQTDIDVPEDGFPNVHLDGDETDVTAAENTLRAEWGAIPASFTDGETYTGTLESWDEDGITLDAGRPVRIPAAELGLGPGDPTQVVERFGLVQHTPMQFVYGDPSRLADAERDRLYDWRRGAGRVNVNSTTRGQARATVNRAGHAQDIVTVERLGLLEQSIITKEGTDPPGLLAAIGEYLPAELRCVLPE
jgi:hypothetical protein